MTIRRIRGNPRFRRTKEEIEMGLTAEEAKEFRKNKLECSEPEPEPQLETWPSETQYADHNEILKRIRRIAQKEVDDDPLLKERPRRTVP